LKICKPRRGTWLRKVPDTLTRFRFGTDQDGRRSHFRRPTKPTARPSRGRSPGREILAAKTPDPPDCIAATCDRPLPPAPIVRPRQGQACELGAECHAHGVRRLPSKCLKTGNRNARTNRSDPRARQHRHSRAPDRREVGGMPGARAENRVGVYPPTLVKGRA